MYFRVALVYFALLYLAEGTPLNNDDDGEENLFPTINLKNPLKFIEKIIGSDDSKDNTSSLAELQNSGILSAAKGLKPFENKILLFLLKLAQTSKRLAKNFDKFKEWMLDCLKLLEDLYKKVALKPDESSTILTALDNIQTLIKDVSNASNEAEKSDGSTTIEPQLTDINENEPEIEEDESNEEFDSSSNKEQEDDPTQNIEVSEENVPTDSEDLPSNSPEEQEESLSQENVGESFKKEDNSTQNIEDSDNLSESLLDVTTPIVDEPQVTSPPEVQEDPKVPENHDYKDSEGSDDQISLESTTPSDLELNSLKMRSCPEVQQYPVYRKTRTVQPSPLPFFHYRAGGFDTPRVILPPVFQQYPKVPDYRGTQWYRQDNRHFKFPNLENNFRYYPFKNQHLGIGQQKQNPFHFNYPLNGYKYGGLFPQSQTFGSLPISHPFPIIRKTAPPPMIHRWNPYYFC